jgi:hypothetical protein
MDPLRAVDLHKWRLKMESWRVCRPVVTDSHQSDQEQDPDPHEIEKYNPDLVKVNRGIRIIIHYVMRIFNSDNTL